MLCVNTLYDRITEDDSGAKENSPTEALKTTSIKIVNKARVFAGITGLQRAGGECLQEIELGAGDT